MIRKILISVLVIALMGCSHSPPKELVFSITEDELETLQLSYYSDYFSFIGQDAEGKVAFALDTNRGQDQDTWQAEHFVVMHDEQTGWQNLEGNGAYPNTNKALSDIPNSDFFSFEGDVVSGIAIHSDANTLTLRTQPMETVIHNKKGLSRYLLGSAEATLTWRGRDIKGRVIYEYLFLPAFNRLSRTYSGVFSDFQGFYASLDGQGDLYMHHQKSDFLADLVGFKDGFVVINGEARQLDSIELAIDHRSLTWGFYRWPMAWRGSLKAGGANYNVSLQLSEKNNIANWVIGGFAMGIVKGQLESSDQRWTVYGLGELIM